MLFATNSIDSRILPSGEIVAHPPAPSSSAATLPHIRAKRSRVVSMAMLVHAPAEN
jgi:hypothetical protein